MCLNSDDVIARRAFELLLNELPSNAFRLTGENEYKIQGKCQIKLRNNQKSVVLVWKSNAKERELTTRKEYVSIFRKWFPGFKRHKSFNKRDYYYQIVQSSEKFLCRILENANEIAIEICNVAHVE
jgi:hypothetical protein